MAKQASEVPQREITPDPGPQSNSHPQNSEQDVQPIDISPFNKI